MTFGICHSNTRPHVWVKPYSLKVFECLIILLSQLLPCWTAVHYRLITLKKILFNPCNKAIKSCELIFLSVKYLPLGEA